MRDMKDLQVSRDVMMAKLLEMDKEEAAHDLEFSEEINTLADGLNPVVNKLATLRDSLVNPIRKKAVEDFVAAILVFQKNSRDFLDEERNLTAPTPVTIPTSN